MNPDNVTGASLSRGASVTDRLKMLARLHKIEARRGLFEILSNPLSNIMTVLVIAIALALPAGLQIMLKNAQSLSQGWDGASRISLYLKTDLPEKRINQLAEEIKQQDGVASVEVITQQQALDDFIDGSGFADAISQLDSNPLPPVLVIQPAASHATPQASELMLAHFEKIKEVDVAQLDLDWVRKLYALLQLAEKAASALALALALAVLLIVGNTIRLSVQNRRDEIEVVKLVGATDAFIRRPFLYTGFWYGFLAGVVCWLLLNASLLWLREPVANLAGLYQSEFQLSGLDWQQSLQLIALSCALGLLGSWLSVGRHIRQIEPR